MKYRFLLPWITVSSCMLLAGCSEESSNWSTIKSGWSKWPEYPDSKNIQSYEFTGGSAKQLSYEVLATYPDTSVAQFYHNEITEPWISCYSEIEWQSFGDISQEPHIFIHQLILHWVNDQSELMLALSIRYVSEGSEFRNNPDNLTQYVDLIEYKGVDRDKAISEFKLACP